MRTVIELVDTNCTWCRDAMIEHLAIRPLVRGVHVNSTNGCLQVDHDHDSPAALMAEIRGDLRGWELADNGERIMVELAVHEVDHCPRSQGSTPRSPMPDTDAE